MKRIMLIMALSYCYVLNAVAQEGKVNGIWYTVISDTEAEVKGGQGEYAKETVVIPQTVKINGKIYTVVGVGEGAFDKTKVYWKKASVIKKVILPPSIKHIGDCAFRSNTGLIEINLPEGLSYLGAYAFSHCESLTQVSLPETLSIIKIGSFWKCTSLQSVSFPSNLEKISDGGEDIDRISRMGAFCECVSLKDINLPSSLKTIGDRAFDGCKSLQTVVIPNSVETVGAMAFFNCESVTKVVLPDHAKFDTYYYKGEPFETFGASSKIEFVSGHNVKYPHYNYKTIFSKYSRFMSNFGKIQNSFSYYGQQRVSDLIEEWQRKKEFETTAQWRERVTEQSRTAKLKDIIAQVRQEYIQRQIPSSISTKLGSYDADYSVFTVNVSENPQKYFEDEIFAVVPANEAQIFKENWDKVTLHPQYGIKDDQLAILSCTFELNGKVYPSAETYSEENTGTDLAVNLSPLTIDLVGGEEKRLTANSQPPIVEVDNSVDRDIPSSTIVNDRTFAIIIGNEKYERVELVEYARNDAQVFAEYCHKTLGLPSENISVYEDATYGTMLSALQHVKDVAEVYGGEIDIIFYYAGHGVPNESSRSAYLLPVDMDGRQTEACLSTSRLYSELGALKAESVVVLMDACFSGAQRGEGMLAATRGIALRVKNDVPQGNMVVFTAATGDETAYPYREKGHGLFTYFLLKKLQDTKGSVTLGELADYVSEQVQQQSVVVNHKRQTPTVVPSIDLADSWRTISLR